MNDRQPTLSGICTSCNIDENEVLNLYQSGNFRGYFLCIISLIGSRVYGTATTSSDWDFLAIVKEGTKTTNLFEQPNLSLSTYEPHEFQKGFPCSEST